jgi:prepilin-type N-terminal cleavage/methylation domain-containing protein
MQTNNRKGFSLIELLIVVVIIGILAAIAIPKFANTKEKAYVAQMKSDLKNLAGAQESYFADHNQYGTLTQLEADPYGFKASGGDKVTPLIEGDASGWSAHLSDERVTTDQKDCHIFGGSGTASDANKGTAEVEGVVQCGPVVTP